MSDTSVIWNFLGWLSKNVMMWLTLAPSCLVSSDFKRRRDTSWDLFPQSQTVRRKLPARRDASRLSEFRVEISLLHYTRERVNIQDYRRETIAGIR